MSIPASLVAAVRVRRKLDARSRELLNQARMVSEVGAGQGSEIGHAHPESKAPPGAWVPVASTLERCVEHIDAAHTNEERAAANAWCEAELQEITHGPVGRFAETVEEFKRRILTDDEGLTCPEIVRREHGTTSVTTLRNMRVADGREPKTGHKLVAVKGATAGDEQGGGPGA